MSDNPWQRKQPIAQPEGRFKFVDIGDRIKGRLAVIEEFNGQGQGWRLTFDQATTRQSGQVAEGQTVSFLATQKQTVGFLEREEPPIGTVLDIQLIGKKPNAAGFTMYDFSIRVVEAATPAAPAAAAPPPSQQPSLDKDLFG